MGFLELLSGEKKVSSSSTEAGTTRRAREGEKETFFNPLQKKKNTFWSRRITLRSLSLLLSLTHCDPSDSNLNSLTATAPTLARTPRKNKGEKRERERQRRARRAREEGRGEIGLICIPPIVSVIPGPRAPLATLSVGRRQSSPQT